MPLSTRKDVRAFYDDTAEAYNRMMDGEMDLPVYAEVLGGLVSRTSSLAGAIVDTSCGSGHMLAKLASEYPAARALVGIDLSPRMVHIAKGRLGNAAVIYQADMAELPSDLSECAALISFFSLHHIAPDDLASCFTEWYRVLTSGGQLVLATWEGAGAIDYGGQTDIVARRYLEAELVAVVEAAGFAIDQHATSPVEGMEMDAVYIFATKPD